MKEKESSSGYVIAAAALLIMTLAWGSMFSIGVFIKPMLAELPLNRGAASLAQSISILLTGFAGIYSGKLNDRWGPRPVVSAGGICLGAGYMLSALTQDIWQLYLFRGLLVGLGMAAIYVPLLATIARWFRGRIGMMTGIVMSGMGLGTSLMPPLSTWLISGYGWRQAYVILGAGILALVVLSAQWLRHPPAGQPATDDAAGTGKGAPGLAAILRMPRMWALFFIFLFLNLSIDAVLVHIVPHATDIGVAAGAAAGILTTLGLVSVPARIGMGNRADRFGSRRIMIVCFSGMLASFIWLLFARTEWAFYAFAVLVGLSYGGVVGLMSLAVAETFGLKGIGLMLGVVACGATIGAASGPALAGFVFDIAGSYQPAFIICTLFTALCLALTLTLRRKSAN